MRLKTQQAIEEYGCLVMGVFPTETSESPLSFAYSIGLPITFPGAPEVLILGLDPDSSQRIINTLVALMKTGKRFVDGDEERGLIQGFPLAFRTVARRHYDDYHGEGYRVSWWKQLAPASGDLAGYARDLSLASRV